MIGRPDLNRYYLLIRTAVMLMLIYPAVKWYGLNGAAIASFIALMFGFILQYSGLRSIIGLDLRQFSPEFLRIMWSLIPVFIIYLVTTQISSMPRPVYLGVGLLGCITGYFLAFRSKISSLNKKIHQHQTAIPR
jgi:O-antigen/teichoic acid export membrane protein